MTRIPRCYGAVEIASLDFSPKGGPMNRIFLQNRFPRKGEPRRRYRRFRGPFALVQVPESLEDRTLLSGLNWADVGPGLVGVFNQLQRSVNDHLLAPKNVPYSLPLVGTELGQAGDPVGQVFANLASNQITSAFQQTPTGPQDVINDLDTALQAYNPQVTNTTPNNSSTEATFSIQASTTSPLQLSEVVGLQLGLPGLAFFGVTANQAVNAHLTFTLDLNFGLDQTGVFVDPTQNNANSPLLQLVVKADLQGFPGAAASLNGVAVEVTDNAQNPSSLDVPVTFNSSAQSVIYNFAEANIDQINFSNSAVGTVNLEICAQRRRRTGAHAGSGRPVALEQRPDRREPVRRPERWPGADGQLRRGR